MPLIVVLACHCLSLSKIMRSDISDLILMEKFAFKKSVRSAIHIVSNYKNLLSKFEFLNWLRNNNFVCTIHPESSYPERGVLDFRFSSAGDFTGNIDLYF